MAYINPTNPDCKNCNKFGLAILPVRYAVVPKTIATSLPATLGNKVTDVKLDHHKYVLRTLRKGFVYLYHEKHPRGSKFKWEVYSVAPSGTLWKQQDTTAITPMDADPACSRTGHNIPASMIAVEKPEACGKVWIAFSEHPWSPETFESFAADAKLRNRRMQTFEPATWVASKGYRHGLEATQANVEQVIEYQDAFAPSSLVGGDVGKISKADGTHDAIQLSKATTCHAMAMRKGQSKAVVEAMNLVGTRPDGKRNPPIILALWDAVGITHELNGFRNDAAGRIEQYHREREMEISAVNQLDGIKVALETRAGQAARADAEAGLFRWNPLQSEARLDAYVKQNPGDTAGYARQADLCARWEKDAEQKVPAYVGRERELHARLPKGEWEKRMAVLDQSALNAKTARSWPDGKVISEAREEDAQRKEKYAIAEAWPKYEKLLSNNASGKKTYKEFKINYGKFMTAVDKIMEDRTHDLISWLKSPSLIDAFVEFDDTSVYDGAAFNDAVGSAVFGMNSSINGRAQILAWVKEMRSSEANLLWRTIGLNNKDGIAELNQALQEAEKHKDARTLAKTIDWIHIANKTLKAFADTYKRSVSASNTNVTALAKGKAFGVTLKSANMRGADKAMITFGDAVFKFVRINSLADFACEKYIQHLFSIRAFVNPGDSARLIITQAQNETEARGQLARRFQSAKGFLAADTPEIRSAQAQNLRAGWEEFKAKNLKGAATSALKDSRLALVVMLIEGSNFGKLIADCHMKGDPKSWWGLAASGISITSALFDIASIPAKSLYGAESLSYQSIKGIGGVLSGGATAIMAVFDAVDADKAFGKGQITISVLYGIKATLGLSSAVLTFATTFSYAAPMIGRVTGNAVLGAAVRTVGARAAAIIGFRVLFMCAGAWVTVGIFGFQVLIWIFSDDELQSWCALGVFGTRRTARVAYKSAAEQSAALEKALVAVGLKHE